MDLERQVKSSTNMVKNQQAPIYGGSKRKRPEKYPYTSKFPKQTHANSENDTENATPRKRAALEKEDDLLTDLPPNIPQFVKCLKGYNVKKSCFLACKVISGVKKTGKMIFGVNFGFIILSAIDKRDRKR
ncbi:hypothetical protein KY290_003215 [Solanum tuberosum]|uniref:Gag-pol polyprotein n=1 Tax=Solanum tuberosum TaxID=4113 RepID=A0ABQ7WUG8_SOLTU|nr:hypothetical protein KY285_003187 [Solanum tuberosum]KAH0783617.1 hypothetical protein KY290_003215 [Solanum tuberosum]